MEKNNLFKKGLIVVVIALFICAGIVPSINGYNKEVEQISIVQSPDIVEVAEETTITFYVFGRTGVKTKDLVGSDDDVNTIYEMFEELKYEMIHYPLSDETQTLKREFIDLLDKKGLIPKGLNKESIFSLLNPIWVQHIPNNDDFPARISSFTVNGDRATAFLCSMASGGLGWIVPPIMIPRPRIVNGWLAFEGDTSVAELYRLRGFIASGGHLGLSLGFIGAGIAFALPGLPPFYGFVGYSLFTIVSAESIERFPPNYPPEITPVYPKDSTENVPISTSELSFYISDLNGDLMSYSVTTDPDIGSGSDNNKKDGTYSIPISGLEGSESYSWHVQVSDGVNTVDASFTFTTEPAAPIVSDPNPMDGERYVPIDLSQLSFKLKDPQGDVMDYTVEITPNIGSGSGTGVGDGTYTIDVSGLEYSQEYKWFVNVTDGINWKHKVFSFQAEHKMIFDPFDKGWQYRKKITINHTKVAGDLINFPVLISTVDSDLRDKAQDDGDDILFMDGPGVANRLYHEIEKYDGSTGELFTWVNVTNISPDQDTIFYMYYGNPGCSNQQAPEVVWDTNYQAVWHLSEDGTGLRHDSTSHYRHATPHNYEGDEAINDGAIDGADDFDGNNDHIRTGVSFDYEYRTVSFWFDTDKIPTSDRNQILDQNADTLVYGSFGASVAPDGLAMSAGREQNPFRYPISTNTWYCVQMVRNGSDTEYYVDGDLVHTGLSGTGGSTWWANENLVIAVDRKMDRRFFDGAIDEVRVSNIARSEVWILAEYNNQNDPSSFFTIGPEEIGP